MNWLNRVKAKVVGWHADYYTGYQQYAEKFEGKKPADGPDLEPEENARSQPAEDPQERAYTEDFARLTMDELKRAGSGTWIPGNQRIFSGASHARIVGTPKHRARYPGETEVQRIFDTLSAEGWTELSRVPTDAGFQFQGRYCGSAYGRYEAVLHCFAADEPLVGVKKENEHGYQDPIPSWVGAKGDDDETTT